MELDLKSQRRNLVILSSTLAAFEVAGGQLSNKLLYGSITLEKPEHLLAMAYLALAYVLWRYWLYARLSHSRFQKLIATSMRRAKGFKLLVQPHIDHFKSESGVEFVDAWNQATNGGEANDVKIATEVERHIFSRLLVVGVDNPKGDFRISKKSYSIPFIRYEWLLMRTWLAVVAGNKSYSDLYLPYLPAFTAATLLCRRVYLTY